MLKGTAPRILSDSEKEKLQSEPNISDFKKNKLEIEAKKNWDLFYKRNTDHFFKDRHWLTREFPVLAELNEGRRDGVVLEVGCGVGNTIYPLLQECPELYIHACDISPRAIELVKKHDNYDDSKVHCFVCDLTESSSSPLLSDHITENTVHLVTLIFVLSAVSPDKMKHVLQNIMRVLKHGGSVLFRDYGLYDHAMLRFKPGHKIQEQFYVRQDGTRAFYFSTEDTAKLFSEAGFDIVFNNYEMRETVNKKENLSVPRVFVQAQFRKPVI